MVEDALGFKFPIPSEYDFQTLEAIIKHRFKDGPGSQEVKVGNYEFINTKNSSQVVSASSRLLPGTNITMAVLLRDSGFSDDTCPIRRCGALKTTAASGGGRIWYVLYLVHGSLVQILTARVFSSECNIWFDRSNRAPNSLQTLFHIIEAEETIFSQSKKRKATSDFAETKKPKRPRLSSLDDAGIPFKNIRFGKHTIPASKEHRAPGNKQNVWNKVSEILSDDEMLLVGEYNTSFRESGQRLSASAGKKGEQGSMVTPNFLNGISSSNSFLDGSAKVTFEHSDTLPSAGFDSYVQQSSSEAWVATNRARHGLNVSSDELYRPALRFWTHVKDELCNSDNVQKHEAFLGLMNDYKARQFDALTLMSEMKDLLRGHDDLLSQFATFFPPQYGYQLGLLGMERRK